MTEYHDYLPANARVIVDYSAKEKVKFSYPIKWTYKKAVWKRAFPTVIGFWVVLNMKLINCIGWFVIVPIFYILTIISPFQYTRAEEIIQFDFLHTTLPTFFAILSMAIYFFGIPAMFTWWLSLKKKRMSKWLPLIGYYSALLQNGTRETIFKPKDVHENKVSIHGFNNIFLNYKCRGDFNKYLQKVEVIELPFKFKQVYFSLFSFKKKKKKQKNDFRFSATFHFTQPIEKGSMTVEYV